MMHRRKKAGKQKVDKKNTILKTTNVVGRTGRKNINRTRWKVYILSSE